MTDVIDERARELQHAVDDGVDEEFATAILVDATTILAIDAGLLPDVVLFGLPPLLTFVAATFTVSLLPFVVLTSFTLRAATVASRTLAAGPFVLR